MSNSQGNFLSAKKPLLAWAEDCRDVCRVENNPASTGEIETAAQRYGADRFVLAIMGMAKRGKSTLINALLSRTDDALAPVDKLPATSVASFFSWAETLNVEVVLRDGSRNKISASEVRNYVTEEGNPSNSKGVQQVEVSGPFSGLVRDVTLLDLPGQGSLHEHHDQILRQFIPQSDAVLLLTTARMPISAEEMGLLNEAQKADIAKLFVAINQADRAEPSELAECEAHNLKCLRELGVPVRKIHQISAQRAFNGEWDGSGVAALLKDIQDFVQAERGKIMAQRLVSTVTQAAAPVLQGLAVRVSAAGKSAEEIAAERARLATERKGMEANRRLHEQTFRQTWDRAIDEAELALPAASARVQERLTRELDATALTQVSAMQKKLPALFSKALGDELGPIITPMETALRDACRKLEASYPRVEITADGTAHISSDGSGVLLKGAIGGGALVVGGLGVVTAASTALAGLAAASTTVSAVAPLASSVASFLAWFGYSGAAGAVTAAGTATVAAPVAAPSALLLAAGPIGWTIAGIGAAAIPLAWGLARKKGKEAMRVQVVEQVRAVFSKLKGERLAAIRGFGPNILEEFKVNLDRRLVAIEGALNDIAARAGDPTATQEDQRRFDRLKTLLTAPPVLV